MSIARSLQPPSDTWDLRSLYPSIAGWEEDFEQESREDFAALSAPYMATLTEQQLFDLLTLYFRLDRRLKKLYTWAHLNHDQDTANDEGKRALQRIAARYHSFSESFSIRQGRRGLSRLFWWL